MNLRNTTSDVLEAAAILLNHPAEMLAMVDAYAINDVYYECEVACQCPHCDDHCYISISRNLYQHC